MPMLLYVFGCREKIGWVLTALSALGVLLACFVVLIPQLWFLILLYPLIVVVNLFESGFRQTELGVMTSKHCILRVRLHKFPLLYGVVGIIFVLSRSIWMLQYISLVRKVVVADLHLGVLVLVRAGFLALKDDILSCLLACLLLLGE